MHAYVISSQEKLKIHDPLVLLMLSVAGESTSNVQVHFKTLLHLLYSKSWALASEPPAPALIPTPPSDYAPVANSSSGKWSYGERLLQKA